MFGFVNINKPTGITSHDVVSKLRRITKIKQIGHTGTLDPLATGVLPIAIGKASRLIEYLLEDKSYIADVKFGYVSDTFDSQGVVEKYSDAIVNSTQIAGALKKFSGEILQIPPAHSAVHYNGKRLYELARQGIIPDDIPARKVVVSNINLLSFDESDQTARIEIDCSKGTYVRSIVHDLGQTLGIGAVMVGLQRTKSGLFTIDNALCLSDSLTFDEISSSIINPLDVLPFSQKELSDVEFDRISHGQSLLTGDFVGGQYVALTQNGQLCAVAVKDDVSNSLITKKVFI